MIPFVLFDCQLTDGVRDIRLAKRDRPQIQDMIDGRVCHGVTPVQNSFLEVTNARSSGQEGSICKRRHTSDTQAAASDRQTGLNPLDIGEIDVSDGTNAFSE
jgi:hypothetical protein